MTKFSNSERLRQRLPGGARGGPEGRPGLRYPPAASRGRQAMQGQSGVRAAPRRQAGSDAGNAGGQLRRTQPRDPSWTAGQGPIRLLSPSSACCPLPRRRRRVAGPGQERGWPRPAGDALTPRQKGCGGPAPHGRAGAEGLTGKEGENPARGLGKERHLQRLQRRARLGGLNPARGAKLAPGPRLGLLCRCQKVNSARLPGHSAPRCRPAAHGEGGGRRPTASHSPWPFTLWRAAGAPRQLHRAPRSRPPHSSCAPAARPPRPALPAPAPPRTPTAQSPRASLASRRTPVPGFAEEGARPRPRGSGPAPVPPHRSRRLGRAGASAGCGALPGLRAHSGVHVYVYVLLRIAVVAAVTCVRCSVLGDLVPCSPFWASPPLSTVPASLFGFTVRATNQAEVSGGTKSLVGCWKCSTARWSSTCRGR